MSQSKVKSFTESIIQTFFGTMFGFFMTLIVFPLFGIYTTVDVVGGITITFMLIAIFKNYLLKRVFMSASVIKNYFVRRYFEKIRIKEVK